MRKYIYIISGLLLICVFQSCQDELESKDLSVYMRNWQSNTIFSIEANVVNGGMKYDGKTEVRFPLYLNRETTADVRSRVIVDGKLAEVYNQKNATSYKVLSDKMYIWEVKEVIIPAGCLQSLDSISIKLNLESMLPGEYILPIRIETVNSADKGVIPSSTAGVVYYRFSLKFNNIDKLNKDPLDGNRIDRSSWEITCTDEPDPINYGADKLLDGDKTTDWKGTKDVKGTFEVDMGKSHTLKGLSYTYCHTGTFRDAPNGFRIYTSEDGKEWFDYGSTAPYSFTPSVLEKEYGINFLMPVTCRYFRVQIESVVYRFIQPRFEELNAFE